MTKYWVIGGEYRDTTFSQMLDGTCHVYGPYSAYDEARSKWAEMSEATRPSCHTRFTIAEDRCH